MATGLEILASGGSGGLGSNSAIPAIGTKDLDSINQTADRLQLQNAQQQQQLFQRKVADRDKLLSALDSGDIKVGDILDEDTPFMKEHLDKLDTAYFDRIKKGINDIDATRKYNKALREATMAATQLQGRKLFYDQESQALKADPLEETRTARQQNLDKIIKGNKWGDITPFVPAVTIDFSGIKDVPKMETTELPFDSKRPYETGQRISANYEQVHRDMNQKFMENQKDRQSQTQLFNSFQKMPAPQAMQELAPVIRRAQEYNTQKGLKQGDVGYANAADMLATDPATGKPIVTPAGTILINKSVPEFASLWALSTVPQFVTDKWDVNKGKLDVAKYQADKANDAARIAETRRHNKAEEGAAYARIGLEKDKLHGTGTEDVLGADAVIKKVVENLKGVGKTSKFAQRFGLNKTVDVADPTILKTFAGIDKDGKTTIAPDRIRYNRSNDQLELVYLDKNKKEINVIPINGLDYLTEKVKQTFPNKDIGTINNIVSQVYEKYGSSLSSLAKEYGKDKNPDATPDLNNYDIPSGATVVYSKDGKSVLGYELNGKKFKF